jgi:ABC transport system ATP-binding/permease protein
MNYLSAEGISKSFGEKKLIENISVGIGKGEKVALVGINGSGKTTLMNILAGKIPPDAGSVSVRKGIKVEIMEQNPVFNEEGSIRENIFSVANPALDAIQLYEKCLEDPDTSADKLQEALTLMDEHNAWEYEQNIKQILSQLGLHDLDHNISQLSGGQRKRVAMARVLISEPDLIIMDEPTNHLDLETIEWLENQLSSHDQSLLLVTHDRYFLDRVANTILELENGNIYRYKGNYNYYLEKKAERVHQTEAEIEKARNLMRKELEWMRRQPKARGTKSQSRIDAFYDLQEKASQKTTTTSLELNVKSARQGGKIIEAEHISKTYGDRTLIKDFSYTFQKKDRVGIIGKNGAGKTTFLNMITGQLTPDTGKVDIGQTTVFGYYSQEVDDMDVSKRVIEIVKDIAEVVVVGKNQTITASQFLQHFQFPPAVQYTPVSKLSGGEKRRLQLLKVLIKNPNFLILDEPTNDLDIVTLNILEDFLLNFDGCLVLVSHDRYFMDRLVDHIFVFEGEGVIKDFPGNYSEYRIWRSEQDEIEAAEQAARDAAPKPQAQAVSTPADTEPKRKLTFAEKKEYEQLEKEIAELEVAQEHLVAKLNEGNGDHTQLAQWSAEIESIVQLLEQKTDRWLTLAEYV